MVAGRRVWGIGRLLLRNPRRLLASLAALAEGSDVDCSCCGYHGRFLPFDLTPSWHCPRCHSLHRHRLLALAMRQRFMHFADTDVLHFAPDPPLRRLIADQQPASYLTADLRPGADRVLDIEAIGLPDGSLDRVIALHVLEHVDDRKALQEIWRVLRSGGQLVAMVPIIEGWAETYENPGVRTAIAQAEHFGQPGHVRYYGRDFRECVGAAGFSLAEFTAGGADSARYRVKRGCKVFLATKPT